MNQSFDTAAQPYGKGHKPVVPEVGAYGFALIMLCLVIYALARRRK